MTDTYTLEVPVEVDGMIVNLVRFRRARAGDMIAIAEHMPAILAMIPEDDKAEVDLSKFDAGLIKAMIGIVSILGRLPEPVVREFLFDDLAAAGGMAIGFLSKPKAAAA